MPEVKLPKAEQSTESVKLSAKEKEVRKFLTKRVNELKEHRKSKLVGSRRSIEDIWREADKEYQPHELEFGTHTRLESEDDGLTSRLIKVGRDDGWQSNQASPDLYVKVNTALSILIDENPEAVFLPSGKRYEKNTHLAYGNWKNSWEVSGAKQQLKNMIFNSAKYGIGYLRTSPLLVEQQKRVRTEYFPDQPEKDKYEEKRLVKFNDLSRESLNPWNVWTSEMTHLGDYHSLTDWYFEKEYSFDRFKQTFKDYPKHKMVAKGSTNQVDGEDYVNDTEDTNDHVTVGFYENQDLDLYGIWIPSMNLPIYSSPLPNDDGMLSLTYNPWTPRDDRTIYGIGIWEVIKNDSVLYDRLSNMTMDQLTLSIYKMFFYKGTDVIGENGNLTVTPGKGIQVVDPRV